MPLPAICHLRQSKCLHSPGATNLHTRIRQIAVKKHDALQLCHANHIENEIADDVLF